MVLRVGDIYALGNCMGRFHWITISKKSLTVALPHIVITERLSFVQVVSYRPAELIWQIFCQIFYSDFSLFLKS